MLLGILLAILMVVCLALVGVILLQRSEGGALGMSGGGPGAFMTARGTGDLLTRTTQILATVFFLLCLTMTLISGRERNAEALVEKVKGLTVQSSAPVSAAPAASSAPALPSGPLNPSAPFGPQPAAPFGAPQTNNSLNLLGNPQVPLAAPVARAPAGAAPKTAPVVKIAKAKPVKAPVASAAPVAAPPALVAAPAPAPAAAPAPTNGQ